MGLREDTMAILHYRDFNRFPIVHFGFWNETIDKWRNEGHISEDEALDIWVDSANERRLTAHLGFYFNWYSTIGGVTGFLPPFSRKIIEVLPGGFQRVMSGEGVVLLEKPGTPSIPAEIDHTFEDRQSWEAEILPRLKFSQDRIDRPTFAALADDSHRERPLGFYCGSLYGTFRSWVGFEGSCYMQSDDEGLFIEVLDTFAALQLKVAQEVLSTGAKFDFGHFWEDICFKNGPLVNPTIFRERCGPWYRKFADLLGHHGIDIVSLDCDGLIDELIPIWLDNGVNTMFPIEVGMWNASIEPWRKKYGRSILGVGGMDKRVFAQDFAAIDAEVDRHRRLVDLGGYIPCPDHRIAPDAKWENVQYYCDRMRRTL